MEKSLTLIILLEINLLMNLNTITIRIKKIKKLEIVCSQLLVLINKEFKNALTDLAGRTMIPVLVRLSGIPEDTKVNAITHEQRMRLLHLFKAFPVSVTGTRPIDAAIVTAGGVSTKEVNPRTMESKLMPGLYFAGEVLDLDGYTGGFNLQIAWSTGYVAGNSI